MTETMTTDTVERLTVRGEVTQAPRLVERTPKNGGTKFHTAALRYWDTQDEDFGVMSASFDLAHRIVEEATEGRKFIASVVKDSQYMNLRDIRFIDSAPVYVDESELLEDDAS